jgi:Mg2+ and Co2+ transporter CorA
MGSKDLTIGEIKDWRKQVLKAYEEGSNRAESAFEEKKISRGQMLNAIGELQRLKLQAAQLLGLIASKALDDLLATDVDSPLTRISTATEQLLKAAQTIEDFLNFLESIADVLRIVGGIVTALQTGAIARIQ